MAEITAALVKDLREKSGVGMMDCKNALQETGGDMEAAMELLRKKGLSKAEKKSGRAAAEGLVAGKLSASGSLFGPHDRGLSLTLDDARFPGALAELTRERSASSR